MAPSVLVRTTNSPWEVFQTCETPQPPGWKVGEYFFRAFCIGVEPRHYWRGWIPSRCTIAPCRAQAKSFFLSAGSMRRWEASGLAEAARIVRQFLDQSPKLPERLRWVVLTSADDLFRASKME